MYCNTIATGLQHDVAIAQLKLLLCRLDLTPWTRHCVESNTSIRDESILDGGIKTPLIFEVVECCIFDFAAAIVALHQKSSSTKSSDAGCQTHSLLLCSALLFYSPLPSPPILSSLPPSLSILLSVPNKQNNRMDRYSARIRRIQAHNCCGRRYTRTLRLRSRQSRSRHQLCSASNLSPPSIRNAPLHLIENSTIREVCNINSATRSSVDARVV